MTKGQRKKRKAYWAMIRNQYKVMMRRTGNGPTRLTTND